MKITLVCLAPVVVASSAPALINPHFTPVDLVGGAVEIRQLEVSPAVDGRATATVTRTLKGAPPVSPALVLDLAEADDSTLDEFPKDHALGLLFTGDSSAAASGGSLAGNKPDAVMQAGLQWFALFRQGDRWRVDRDPLDLNAVWAGSASMLLECVKYILAVPGADVPTAASTKFVRDERIGSIPGTVAGMVAISPGRVIIRCAEGDRVWDFPSRKETNLVTKTAGGITEFVCDYDGDGVLDKLMAGADGPLLLRGGTADVTAETGELEYHGRSKPAIASVAECDFNQDGRPDVVVAYGKGLHPLAFFNRGFGCFGLARELLLQDSELGGAKALADGQQAAAFVDVNGDGSVDLLAVAPNGDLWALYTAPQRKPGPSVTVSAPAPLAVVAREGARSLGARQVLPGTPATFWLRNPGPLDLEWGAGKKKRVIAVRPQAVELTP